MSHFCLNCALKAGVSGPEKASRSAGSRKQTSPRKRLGIEPRRRAAARGNMGRIAVEEKRTRRRERKREGITGRMARRKGGGTIGRMAGRSAREPSATKDSTMHHRVIVRGEEPFTCTIDSFLMLCGVPEMLHEKPPTCPKGHPIVYVKAEGER